MTSNSTAEGMMRECVRYGQSAHAESNPQIANELRNELRQIARERDVKIRTAFVDEVVMVIRVDASLWDESAKVMREKLTPKDLRSS